MMQRSNTVVPPMQPLTEEQFRNAWLVSLSRLCRNHGDGQVARWLGVSERHLRNVKSGASVPTADKIWNLLAYDDSAHDEIDAEYGARNVAKDAICSTDPLTLSLITLARDVAEAEAADSPGGVAVVDEELRKMDEPLLRKINRVTSSWIDRLDEMRRPRPRVVGGRS